MRKDKWVAILVAGVALVLAACASPTGPTKLEKREAKANNMWVCPTETGMVIRTGNEPPSSDCQPYNP